MVEFNVWLYYLLAFGVVIYFIYVFSKNKKMRALIPKYLQNGAVVLDVRTTNEYKAGARPGSINIPLDILEGRLSHLDRSQTILICCATGMRSKTAEMLLKKNGFKNVINVGAWTNTLC